LAVSASSFLGISVSWLSSCSNSWRK
jgi:hypothetical protein